MMLLADYEQRYSGSWSQACVDLLWSQIRNIKSRDHILHTRDKCHSKTYIVWRRIRRKVESMNARDTLSTM